MSNTLRIQTILAWRYLASRKMRTGLTTLSILLGVMLIFGLNGLVPAIIDSFQGNLATINSEVDLTITSVSRAPFEPGAVGTVADTPGVDAASGLLSRPIILPADQSPRDLDGQPLTSLILVGFAADSLAQVHPLEVLSGAGLQSGDRDGVLISSSLAKKTGLAVGDRLDLPSASGLTALIIKGVVLRPPSLGAEEIFVPLQTAQQLLNLPGKINTIEARFSSGVDRQAVQQQVLERLGDGYQVGGIAFSNEVEQFMELGDYIFTLIGVIALLMGGFIIFNSMRTAVVERRHDTGMLRSLGASRRTVRGLILTESLIVGVIGTVLGLLAGYGFVILMIQGMAPLWQQRLGFSLGEPSFSPGTFLLSITLGVGVTVLGAWLPARSASQLSPLEALRPESESSGRKTARTQAYIGIALVLLSLVAWVSQDVRISALGIVFFITGLVLIAPALVQPIASSFGGLLNLIFAREGYLAKGNLTRQPGRSAVTISAMMIGLAVVLGVSSLVTSISNSIFAYIDQSLRADYLFMPQSQLLGSGNVGAAPELASLLRQVDGIAAVTTLRASSTRIGTADLQVVGIEPQAYQDMAGFLFSDGEAAQVIPALASGRTLVANDIFAAQNQIKTGQKLTLLTPNGPQEYLVAAIGSEYILQKIAAVYISQHNLAQDFNENSDVVLLANRRDGADPAALDQALASLVKGYPAFSLYSFSAYRAEIQQQSNAKLASLYFIIGALALPSLLALINTLGINVLERTREIGVLRAVGSTRRQVRRMILAESLVLAAAGTAFGILAGLWLGYLMVQGIRMTGIKVDFFFPYGGLLTTIAVGLLFGVVGALIPARQAARLDIVRALQYE
jgi:putative ABC transport system permease protein